MKKENDELGGADGGQGSGLRWGSWLLLSGGIGYWGARDGEGLRTPYQVGRGLVHAARVSLESAHCFKATAARVTWGDTP